MMNLVDDIEYKDVVHYSWRNKLALMLMKVMLILMMMSLKEVLNVIKASMVVIMVDDDDYEKKVVVAVVVVVVDELKDQTDHQNLIDDHPMWMISLMKQV